jgi:predicted nucleic acid-binding protein
MNEADRPHRALEEREDLSGRLTLILLTPGLLPSDRETIKEAAAALAAPPQEGERLCSHPYHVTPLAPGVAAVCPECRGGFKRAAPTPDREALRPAIVDVLRKFSSAVDEWRIRADESLSEGGPPLAGAIIEGYNTATDRILDLLAALPPREPKWLAEYEWRKLTLIEAATICGRDGSNPAQDAAERALDEWVLTALPGGREHPIGTCFAERGDMGEEWTYCPFCGGRLAWSSISAEKRTAREREPDPLLEEAARYVEAMTRYQPDAHTRRLGREMAQCIRVMPAIEPPADREALRRQVARIVKRELELERLLREILAAYCPQPNDALALAVMAAARYIEAGASADTGERA